MKLRQTAQRGGLADCIANFVGHIRLAELATAPRDYEIGKAMNISSAIAQIRSGRKAILFLGAGFSNDTINVAGTSTPSSLQLADRILRRLQIPGTAGLGLAIDKLRERLPPQEGFSFIKRELTVTSLTANQKAILSLPWTRLYTTNVDNIGSDLSERTWRDATQDDDQVNPGDYVYLHGCIANCTATNFYANLKLGEQLYLQNSRSGSRYFHALRQDLHECDAVFVVGYSMGDPDFANLFYNSDDLLNKCFVFSGTPDELSAHRISLIGNNTGLGLADLARLTQNRSEDNQPTYRAEISIDHDTFDSKEITQAARQNLLIFGRYDDNVARSSWSGRERSYAISRQEGEKLAALTPPKIAIVHSHLGNGKSVLFHYTRYLLAAGKKRSFTIREDVSAEALTQSLLEIPPESHVFFEGDVFAIADSAEVIRQRSLVLCATSRTTTIRVAMPALARTARGLVQLFDTNQLSQPELVTFHDLIDSMAFWPPDLAQIARQRRLEKLENGYGSNINAIVLKIFENKKVKDEILAQWTSALKGLRPILDHLVVASYMQMIDISVPAYLINEFQNMDYGVLRVFENDIIRVSHSGNIAFGNSIIGEFVLQNHTNRNDVVGALVRFTVFVDGHSSQRSWQWVVRRLLRYWNLQRLLGSSTAPNDVLDRASYVPSVNADPLFWVQYSISQMENKKFLAADRFLSRAYERAKEKGGGFDTYQIDTHAARLTVRKIIDGGTYDAAPKDVLAAVAKLRSVIQRRPDDTFHVASVITLMLRSDVSWAHMLSNADFSIFRRELTMIGEVLSSSQPDTVLFAAERQAIDLIRKLFG